jgi:hypothetical protein
MFLLYSGQLGVSFTVFCKLCYHALWMLQGPMGHASKSKCNASSNSITSQSGFALYLRVGLFCQPLANIAANAGLCLVQ